MSGANVAVKAGLSGLGSYVGSSVVGSKRSAPYRTSEAQKRYRMTQEKRRRKAYKSGGGRAEVPTVYRGRKHVPRITSQNLIDMYAPEMHINRQSAFEFSWTRGQQGINLQQHLTVAEIDECLTKIQDSSMVNPLGSTSVFATSTNYTFWYNGCTLKFTLQNSSTNDVIIDMLEMQPKRPTALTPGDCWGDDMTGDNSVQNLQAPQQVVDRTFIDIDCRPGSTGQKFNMTYRKKYMGRVHLKPGEEYVFNYKIPGFSYNVGRYNQHVDTTNAAGTDRAAFFEKSRLFYFFGKSQLVQDGSDADTSFGSGKVSCVLQKKYSYRCVPAVKTDQHVYINELPGTFTTEYHINEATGDAGSYAGI